MPYGGSQARGWIRAYATATATQDPSRVCDLHHSSRQRQILHPWSKGRDRTRNLMVPSQTDSLTTAPRRELPSPPLLKQKSTSMTLPGFGATLKSISATASPSSRFQDVGSAKPAWLHHTLGFSSKSSLIHSPHFPGK